MTADRSTPNAAATHARHAALAWLARREHSSAELAGKLVKKGYTEALAKRVIADLANSGMVSDARFTEMVIRARRARGFGPVRIERELKDKGVGAEFITASVNKSDPGWLTHVRAVRKKKFGSKLPKNFADKARQARFLQYRGFTYDQIQLALGANDDA